MGEYKLADFRLQTEDGLFNITVEQDDMFDSPREWDDTNASNMICFHSRYNLGDKHNYDNSEELFRFLLEDRYSYSELTNVLEPYFKRVYGNLRYKLHEDDVYHVIYEYNGDEVFYGSFEVDSHESVVVLDHFREIYDEMLENFVENEYWNHISNNDMIELIEKTVIILPLYLYDHSGITMNTTGFSCGWDSGQVGWIYSTVEDYTKAYGGEWTTEKVIEDLIGEVKTYDQYLTGDVYWFNIEKIVKCECCSNESREDYESCGGFYGTEEIIEVICEHFDVKYYDEIKNNF